MSEISNAVIAEMISGLRGDLSEVKEITRRLDSADRERIAEHIKLEAKTEAAHRRIDVLTELVNDMKKQVDGIEKMLPSIITAYQIGMFILGAMGLSVIALIWALITGQAHVTFGP